MLKPKHISSYSLIIEEGTPFFYDYGEKGLKKKDLPDEETDRKMYSLTGEKLLRAGYRRYEISNYALPGYESRHNSAYWTGREYFGLGLGASSFVDNVRYSNVRDMGAYLMKPDERVIEEVLDKKALMTEFMILGLRMTEGVSKKTFEERFGIPMSSVYAKIIRRFIDEKALTEEGDRVRLTDFGLDVSNTVFAEFL
jgi:oxygen-independent coproporphyrinogen-3 oxidase